MMMIMMIMIMMKMKMDDNDDNDDSKRLCIHPLRSSSPCSQLLFLREYVRELNDDIVKVFLSFILSISLSFSVSL